MGGLRISEKGLGLRNSIANYFFGLYIWQVDWRRGSTNDSLRP